MPMYDYRCTACVARFEAWQKFTDDPISVCPTCSGPAQRVIHAAGIMFKGSGFYSTDSKSAAAIPPAEATTAPAASEASAAPKASGETSASADSSAATPAAPATPAPKAPTTKAS